MKSCGCLFFVSLALLVAAGCKKPPKPPGPGAAPSTAQQSFVESDAVDAVDGVADEDADDGEETE